MTRLYNFSAGPAAMPTEVLQKAQQEFLDFNGGGASIMEISHRSEQYLAVAQKAEQDFRDLLKIPDNYKVLFMHGGASLQFPAVPMNLLRGKTSADYVNTGIFSVRAAEQAKKYCDVSFVADANDNGLTSIPEFDSWQLNKNAAYVHYTPSETIGGMEFQWIPETGDIPLVADMTSNIMSRSLDVNKFGVFYAGSQKNIGPAGLAVVVVREDLMGDALPITPDLLNWQITADYNSMLNTPPMFSWYMAGLVFEWLKDQGGLDVMAKINQRKADKLYQAVDASDFYSNPIDEGSRSMVSVPFVLANEKLNNTFLQESEGAGLLNLRGHRSVGGMRACIYNAVPEKAVDTLIDFMTDFEQRHT